MTYVDLLETEADTTPIMFVNRQGAVDMTSVEVIKATIYDTSDLKLEEAAKLAAIIDQDEAENFLASFIGIPGAVVTIR